MRELCLIEQRLILFFFLVNIPAGFVGLLVRLVFIFSCFYSVNYIGITFLIILELLFLVNVCLFNTTFLLGRVL